MSASGSSLRILGLGSLLKIGSLVAATVTYLLLSRIEEMQTADRTEQQKKVRSYGYSSLDDERARAQRVKVESPGDVSPRDIHPKRESPVHIVTDIRVPETTQVQKKTPAIPAAAEDSTQPEKLSIKSASENSIRAKNVSAKSDELRDKLAAIEAIGYMVAGGDQKALNQLFEHVQSENFLVRQEAIRRILQYGRREDKELLHETLPVGDWYIMDIRPADMRKVYW
jgi:hypothetical protein